MLSMDGLYCELRAPRLQLSINSVLSEASSSFTFESQGSCHVTVARCTHLDRTLYQRDYCVVLIALVFLQSSYHDTALRFIDAAGKGRRAPRIKASEASGPTTSRTNCTSASEKAISTDLCVWVVLWRCQLPKLGVAGTKALCLS